MKYDVQYYKKCTLRFGLDTFDEFLDNVLCEEIFNKRETSDEYEIDRETPRKEAVGVAVKMKKILGKNVPLESDFTSLQSTYADVGIGYDSAQWISPIVATALKYGIITEKRKIFEAERSITRAEAFSMIMKSVCILPSQENIH